MTLRHIQMDKIEAKDICQLIEGGVRESLTLEYKRQLPDFRNEEAKLKFVKTLSSFANKNGGMVLFGIKEKKEGKKNTGLPEEITGVTIDSIDEVKRKIQQILRNMIRPIISNVFIRDIEIEGKVVLLVRVPRSFNAPHQISKQYKGGTFHIRTDGDTEIMNVEELRDMFLDNESSEAEHINFIRNRLEVLSKQENVPFKSTPRQVCLHSLPIGRRPGTIDPRDAQKSLIKTEETRRLTGHSQFSHSGFLSWDNQGIDRRTIQIFRNGTIEQTANLQVETKEDRYGGKTKMLQLVKGGWLENWIMEATRVACSVSLYLGIDPPLRIGLSMTGMKDHYIFANTIGTIGINSDDVDEKHFVDDPLVLTWPVILDLTQPDQEVLEPLFDHIWQSAGKVESPYVALVKAEREKEQQEQLSKADDEST